MYDFNFFSISNLQLWNEVNLLRVNLKLLSIVLPGNNPHDARTLSHFRQEIPELGLIQCHIEQQKAYLQVSTHREKQLSPDCYISFLLISLRVAFSGKGCSVLNQAQ